LILQSNKHIKLNIVTYSSKDIYGFKGRLFLVIRGDFSSLPYDNLNKK